MTSIDRYIREIPLKEAQDNVTSTWTRVETLNTEKKSIPKDLYLNMTRYSARIILAHLEKGVTESDTWTSYCDFFLQVMLAWGTAGMYNYIVLVKRVLNAVLMYVTEPTNLIEEYLRCTLQQHNQREEAVKALQAGKGDVTSDGKDLSMVVETPPDLEYAGAVNAVVELHEFEEAAAYVSELPHRLTFSHSRGIIRLTLCNPLQIPPCSFVTCGYSCDTCHQRGIRVAFQAMLYEDEDEQEKEEPSKGAASGAGRQEGVRSAAQLSKSNYGYDMCLSCAVFFYRKHHLQLRSCLSYPFKPCVLGHASGIAVHTAHHTRHQELLLRHTAAAGATIFSTATVAPPRRHSPRKGISPASASATPVPTGNTAGDRLLPGGEGFARTAPPVSPPLSWRCSRKASTGSDGSASPVSSRGAVTPPLSRFVPASYVAVQMSVSIAPYEARPIAWVLPPDTDADREAGAPDLQRLLPPPDWHHELRATARRTADMHLPHARRPSMCDSHEASFASEGRASPGSSEADECPICLRSLSSEVPVIATRCKHVFHVECITEYVAQAENRCPLCRVEMALPDRSVKATLAENVYSLTLRVPPEAAQRNEIRVALGAFINKGSRFENITNLSAVTTFTIKADQILQFEAGEEPLPHRGTTAARSL